MPTTWSSAISLEYPPGVVFYADAGRVRLVQAVAEANDVHLSVTPDGLLVLAACCVTEVLSAADGVSDWAAEFDALPPPPSASLRGPDGYWAEDLDAIREKLDLY